MLKVWISEEQGAWLLFILLELATREAVFSNIKLCFVHFLCNSFWNLKDEDFFLKSGISTRTFEIC